MARPKSELYYFTVENGKCVVCTSFPALLRPYLALAPIYEQLGFHLLNFRYPGLSIDIVRTSHFEHGAYFTHYIRVTHYD